MKRFLFTVALCGSLLVRTATAQETEPAPTSQLTGAKLPAGALRLKPSSIPQDISAALTKVAEMGGDKVKQGRVEVLAWTGPTYKLARVKTIKSEIEKSVKATGWSYEESATGAAAQDVTVVSMLRTFPTRKALIGFWAPTADALVLSWTEMLPKEGGAQSPIPTPVDTPDEEPAATPVKALTTSSTGATAVTFDIAPSQGHINVMKSAMPTIPAFPKVTPKPGFVRGYIKDMNGKPLKGAKIGVRSTSAGGFYSGAQGQSDEKGYYEIEVPWGAASYYCAGYTMDWGEGRGAFGLHPVDGEAESFASAKGSVENWVMLPYGIGDRDGVSDQPHYSGNYYGGTFSIGYWLSDERFGPDKNLPDGSQIEITLTPTAPILGGGKGKTFVIRKPVTAGGLSTLYVNNIPVTTYRLSGTLIQGGNRSPLHIKETGPYSNRPFGLEPKAGDGQVTLTFRPGGAKAESATASHGNWDSLDMMVSRP